MNKPQRYDPDFRIGALYMDESDDGDYVEYEDYAILADRLARLTAELERSRRECEGLREALPRIAFSLRKACASLPAPENKGTIESAMQTGLSIALCLVEDELAALSAGGSDGNA